MAGGFGQSSGQENGVWILYTTRLDNQPADKSKNKLVAKSGHNLKKRGIISIHNDISYIDILYESSHNLKILSVHPNSTEMRASNENGR